MSSETVSALPQSDSLGRRYVFKLLSNGASIPLNLLMEALVPRALGPAGYGNYSFATNIFYNFTNFLDMGTTTCLSTNLAKRPGEFGLVAFYGRVALVMLVLCLLSGLLLNWQAAGEWFMPGVPLWLALPAAFWAYLGWAGRTGRAMNDALGITVPSEVARMSVNLVSALALLLLYYCALLNKKTLFLHQYLFLGLAAFAYIWVMRRTWPQRTWRLSRPAFAVYAREFWTYSSPLFVLGLCSSLIVFGERWLLQLFDGSEQQGYFALGQRVGVACFMLVAAMTPLLMREFSMAHGRKDPEAMGRLMDRFAPMLYAAAAWFSCFTAVEAVAVVRLFGGEGFSGAVLPVQIMALFPIHQAYGQLGNSIYYAAGATRTLRNITIAASLVGLGIAWLFLAPKEFFGLELGAAGLALKMVLVQWLTVNILLLACRKLAPYKYGRNLLHQAVCPACLAGLAWLAREGTLALGLGGLDDLSRFFVSGIGYSALTLGLLAVFPFALGVTRREIRVQSQRILGWLLSFGKKP